MVALLKACGSKSMCEATGKQFSGTVLRYLCLHSMAVLCREAVEMKWVWASAESTERERPLTISLEVQEKLTAHEDALSGAVAGGSDLDSVSY